MAKRWLTGERAGPWTGCLFIVTLLSAADGAVKLSELISNSRRGDESCIVLSSCVYDHMTLTYVPPINDKPKLAIIYLR